MPGSYKNVILILFISSFCCARINSFNTDNIQGNIRYGDPILIILISGEQRKGVFMGQDTTSLYIDEVMVEHKDIFKKDVKLSEIKEIKNLSKNNLWHTFADFYLVLVFAFTLSIVFGLSKIGNIY